VFPQLPLSAFIFGPKPMPSRVNSGRRGALQLHLMLRFIGTEELFSKTQASPGSYLCSDRFTILGYGLGTGHSDLLRKPTSRICFFANLAVFAPIQCPSQDCLLSEIPMVSRQSSFFLLVRTQGDPEKLQMEHTLIWAENEGWQSESDLQKLAGATVGKIWGLLSLPLLG
jgi:hypothetical protein